MINYEALQIIIELINTKTIKGSQNLTNALLEFLHHFFDHSFHTLQKEKTDSPIIYYRLFASYTNDLITTLQTELKRIVHVFLH